MAATRGRGYALAVHVRAARFDELLMLALGDTELVFGRGPDCDVVLPSKAVSRRHVTIAWKHGALSAQDLSSHGTWVDGTRVQGGRVVLGERCDLEVGPYRLELKLVRPAAGAPELAPPAVGEVSIQARRALRSAVLEGLDLLTLDRSQMDRNTLGPAVHEALERAAASMGEGLPRGPALQALLRELADEVLGLGPLEPLLADPSVSEIMVVDPETIYVERDGRIQLSASRFTDDQAVRSVLERIVTPLGRRVDESQPMVDARLPDGSRVNAVIPPLALKGAAITIRRFSRHPITIERLVSLGAMSEEMAVFLERSVQVRVNMVIAGGTGSGKTTLLNVLSAAIPDSERVVTIEDAAELSLRQRHVVSLESRPPNMEGQGAVSIRDLVRNALRMRPDRIVVGECRGGEALDMLQAMNTGHDGSMTTTHANSPREAVQRLETLCLMSGIDLPLAAIRRQIAGSVNLLLQQARFSDGSRRITHVTEVAGLSDDGELELRDVFRFEPARSGRSGKLEGVFVATGVIPNFVDRFVTRGLSLGGLW
ncbi:MAG: ATPase, T2SS/T4P/T4SS family [Myxococcales bacterium]